MKIFSYEQAHVGQPQGGIQFSLMLMYMFWLRILSKLDFNMATTNDHS